MLADTANPAPAPLSCELDYICQNIFRGGTSSLRAKYSPEARVIAPMTNDGPSLLGGNLRTVRELGVVGVCEHLCALVKQMLAGDE